MAKLLKSYDDACLTYGESFRRSNRQALEELKNQMHPGAFALAVRQAEDEMAAHQAELQEALEEEENMATFNLSTTNKSRRGFAALDPERLREIAKKGGRAVPPEKRTFSKSKDLAAAAGRKGGLAVPKHKRSFATDKALASQAGRKGGAAFAKRVRDEPSSG